MTSKLASFPCSLPICSVVPTIEEATAHATKFASKLTSLNASDVANNVSWRDLFALTGSLRTFYGTDVISTWQRLAKQAGVESVKLVPGSVRIVSQGPDINWFDAAYSFETTSAPQIEGTILLSVADGKIWLIRSILDRLKNHPDIDEYSLQTTVPASTMDDVSEDNHVFDCAIIGAGQAGLSVAGRLKSQNVDYVVLDRNKRVGDAWRNRYDTVKLHTTRDSSYLPFNRTFDTSYPVYLSKDDLAKGYENWVNEFQIKVWGSTVLEKGTWLPEEDAWELQLTRNGKPTSIKARHIVMATGAGCQTPIMPVLDNVDHFRGSAVHSASYKSATSWKGMRGVVVGTANTGHDVAEDMLAAGLSSVTMVQRSPTYVLPTEYYKKFQDGIYNQQMPTKIADRIAYSNPLAIGRLSNMRILHKMADEEPERFDALEKANFKLIRHGDIVYQLFERFGGHYMDVGASQKIADGLVSLSHIPCHFADLLTSNLQIKMKSDALVTGYYEDGLVFDDGSKLGADVIVFATGFEGNMKVMMRDIFSDQVVAQLDDFWGLDDEGEIQGAFRPSGRRCMLFPSTILLLYKQGSEQDSSPLSRLGVS
jgi:thioredoxin reductase